MAPFLLLLALLGLSSPSVASTASRFTLDTPDEEASADSRPVISCSDEASQQSCQNFARVSRISIMEQIHIELNASYTYMGMSSFFNRDDVAYPGFAKLFTSASDEDREHAQKLIDYMGKRGGWVWFRRIPPPAKQTWTSPLEALEDALLLEHAVNKALLDLHWEAQMKNDPHLQDFIESEFLTEQVDSIRQLAEWRTIMARMTPDSLGWYQFDKYLLQRE